MYSSGKLNELLSIDDLDSAIAESHRRPVLLFKHSLTCPISTRAYHELQSHLERADCETSYNLITVQTGRAVSNEASAKLHLHHESPQAILIRNGHSVWNASHGEITAPALDRAIRSID
jgi:bacillithiol system protein YtxJ